MNDYKLLKMNNTHAVVQDMTTGEIKLRPINEDARKVLGWYYKNIPANQQ